MSQCYRWADWNGPEVLNANSWFCLEVCFISMKHATKRGIAVACKKEERKELAAEEES